MPLLRSELSRHSCFFFFFNDTAPTEIYPLPLHDPLPIYSIWTSHRPTASRATRAVAPNAAPSLHLDRPGAPDGGDRKSTRLNSSHSQISYAVFCLKKKKAT